MERFIFVTAVTIALIFGVFYMVGGPSWSFNINDFEGGPTDPVLETSAARLEPQTYQALKIDVEHAVARVVVTPEDRQDISIEIDNPGHLPMPEIRLQGGDLSVDGRLRGRIRDCNADSGVDVRGYGAISQADSPLITIHTPRAVQIEVGGAANSEIGPSASLDASFSGCGSTQIADVAGEMMIDLAGSGTVRTGVANTLDVDLAGSGSLETGAIAGGAEIDVAGSGEVTLASVTGALQMDGAGSGDLNVRGGAITSADIDLAGSGGVNVAAPVEHLTVSIVGSGDVNIAGVVGTIDADIAGSGSIRADSVTGAVHKEIWGAGEVLVGGRSVSPAE